MAAATDHGIERASNAQVPRNVVGGAALHVGIETERGKFLQAANGRVSTVGSKCLYTVLGNRWA